MSKSYDPCKVSVVVNGFTISGYAEDSFVKIEAITKESVTSKSGVCGETTWSENKDERRKITLTLLGNSPSNAFLSKLQLGRIPLAIAITNNSGGKYIGGGVDARITERPSTEFGKEMKDREWMITCNDYSDIYPDE